MQKNGTEVHENPIDIGEECHRFCSCFNHFASLLCVGCVAVQVLCPISIASNSPALEISRSPVHPPVTDFHRDESSRPLGLQRAMMVHPPHSCCACGRLRPDNRLCSKRTSNCFHIREEEFRKCRFDSVRSRQTALNQSL